MNVKRSTPVGEKNIVLIGFMGVGKTTIGKLAAKKLCRDFIDIDQEIEKDLQMSIPEMFKQKGEAFFQKTEKEYIVQMCEHKKSKVVSLGGGSFLQEDIRKKCLEHCFVIFLDLTWENWKQRIDLLLENRPILHNRSIEQVKQLFNERKSIYAFHHLRIETDNLSAEEVADCIADKLKPDSELCQP